MSSTGFDEYRHLTEAARRLEAYKRMEPCIQNDGHGVVSVMAHNLWAILYHIHYIISYTLYHNLYGLSRYEFAYITTRL